MGECRKELEGKPRLDLVPRACMLAFMQEGDVSSYAIALVDDLYDWFERVHDSNVLRSSLRALSTQCSLNDFAAVMELGASKYGPHDWRVGGTASRYFASALRHLVKAFLYGERLDAETGVSHVAHAMANISFLIEWEKSEYLNDDRPYVGDGPQG